ncbi:MAG: hypothetical protein IJR50_06030 [Treponema sp.]|nr:hypothetical protein [Treponema sp.]
MNTTRGVYIPAASLSHAAGMPVLREGASVRVRVIAQTGSQSYVVSFAGNRFAVTSRVPLAEGAVFNAVVSFQNGTITLKGEHAVLSHAQLVQTLSPEVNADGSLAPELARYFSELGLRPDAVTLALFNAVKEFGAKFDVRVLNRVHDIALKFPGKEKEAAEAALMMEQKGMCASSDAVHALLDNDESNGNENGSGADSGARSLLRKNDDMHELLNALTHEIRQFFCGIFDGSGSSVQECDVLTVFNHRASAAETNIVQIPFAVAISGKECGSGILRCFFEKNQKKMQKCAITINFLHKKYYFVIYLNGKTAVVKYGSDEPHHLHASAADDLRDCLQKALSGQRDVVVVNENAATLAGFCSERETIAIVRGSV